VLADYQNGVGWSDLGENSGARLTDIISWLGNVQRSAARYKG